MHTINARAAWILSQCVAARLGLAVRFGFVASLLALAAPAGAAEVAAPQSAMGEPVNRYAADANIYSLYYDGDIHPWPVQGQVWLMAGEPGESNVVVLAGDEGVLVVDTGEKAMAPKLLEQIRRLAQEHAGTHKEIRVLVNTNGLADHIGGNGLIRASGRQVIAGEAAPQANALGDAGAAVWAHANVLTRLVAETAAGGANAPTQAQWPSDAADQDVYGLYFSNEAVQLHHPRNANTDGQLMVLFRQSDVIAAGDVLNMTSYPVIDVARGGTIDGELVALNKLMDLIVPRDQVAGGTVVIPGHGRLTDLGDVARYTVMITTIRNRVQYYKNQGKSLAQVLALNASAEYDSRWSAQSGLGTAREFLTAVYNTLPAKGPFFSMETNTSVPATGPDSARKRF